MSAGGSAEELRYGASGKEESVKYRVRDQWHGRELGVPDAQAQSYMLSVTVKITLLCSVVITASSNCLIYSDNKFCYLLHPGLIHYGTASTKTTCNQFPSVTVSVYATS